jgi:hypothetical protein
MYCSCKALFRQGLPNYLAGRLGCFCRPLLRSEDHPTLCSRPDFPLQVFVDGKNFPQRPCGALVLRQKR